MKILYALCIATAFGCSNPEKDKAPESGTVNNPAASVNTPANNTVNVQQGDISRLSPFRIYTTGRVIYTNANLDKSKPVMLIYFAPDCGHCEKLMSELKPEMKKLDKLQVLMITWAKPEPVIEFYNKYGLDKYPNVIMGTEGTANMQVQRYYQLKETPFVAVYSKDGKLVKAYEKAPKLNELLATVKKV